MVPIARRNLLVEKTRFAVAVGGVAFAVFLIVLIQSLFMGFRNSAGALIEDLPFELWVVQDGTFDLYHSSSILPSDYADRLRGVPGVAYSQRILGRQMLVDIGGEAEREFFFALDQPVGRQEVAAGFPRPSEPAADVRELPPLPGPGELIISSGLARKHDIGIGEQLPVGEQQLTVSGTTNQGTGIRSFSFLHYDDARDLFGLNDSVNYVSVVLDEGSEAEQVAARIEETLPGVDVLDRQEFADRSRTEIEVFTPILAIVLSISFVVGAAVISLTIYTATIEKARDFGVLKALGASRWYLYRMVTFQSLAVGLLGFVAGVPLAIGVSRLTTSIVPEFVTLFQPLAIAGVLGVVLLMSLVSALLPAHRISRIDPAMVFRA